jgi:hypothetical protein
MRSKAPLSVLVATFVLASGLCGIAVNAEAHTLFMSPKPRDQMDGYKPTRTKGFVLPCGVARSGGQPTTTLKSGAMQMVQWKETVYHPGCFIIDFAKSETDQFQRIAVEAHATGQTSGRVYQKMIQLPNMQCDGCILRIRQYMADASPCPPADLQDMDADLYYSCANVVLSSAGGGGGGKADGSAPPDDASTGTGGAVGTGGTGIVGTGGGGGTGPAGTGGYGGSGGTSGATGGTGGSPITTGGTGGAPSGTGGATGPGASGTGGTGQPGPRYTSASGCAVAGRSSAFGALVMVAMALVIGGRRRRSR